MCDARRLSPHPTKGSAISKIPKSVNNSWKMVYQDRGVLVAQALLGLPASSFRPARAVWNDFIQTWDGNFRLWIWVLCECSDWGMSTFNSVTLGKVRADSYRQLPTLITVFLDCLPFNLVRWESMTWIFPKKLFRVSCLCFQVRLTLKENWWPRSSYLTQLTPPRPMVVSSFVNSLIKFHQIHLISRFLKSSESSLPAPVGRE